MCIRDRKKKAKADTTNSLEHLIFQTEKTIKEHADKISETCLLYTSDAADERSSVDLGGRRIIKKKTHYT